MKNNKKGFTLAELLIVVAIIAVLVAISIPIFTTQLEKAREATDAANLRSAYAQVAAAALTETTVTPITVDQKQEKTGWDIDPDLPFSVKAPTSGSTASYWTVSWDATNDSVVGN